MMMNRYTVGFGDEMIGNYDADTPDEAIRECKNHMHQDAPQMLRDYRQLELQHRGKSTAHLYTWLAVPV